MPIVIKDVKLTEEVTTDLSQIIASVRNVRPPYLAKHIRETEEGIVIPNEYQKLFDAIKKKYQTSSLMPINQEEVRQRYIERNRYFFDKFMEYNTDYLKTDKNVIVKVTSAPGGLIDPEKVTAFLSSVFSKITPAENHKFKVTAKYRVLDSIREKLNADDFKDGSGASVNGRCVMMAMKWVEGRMQQRGTVVAVVVPATKVSELFEALAADMLFERIPAIRFVNPETRRQHLKELREKTGTTGDGSSATRRKQQKHKVAKSGIKIGHKPAVTVEFSDKNVRPAKGERRKPAPRKMFLPCLLTIAGLPEGIVFDDIKANLDEKEHADILKAIAESKQRRPRNPKPSEASFFCTRENGKILKEAFGNMDIDGAALSTQLTDKK